MNRRHIIILTLLTASVSLLKLYLALKTQGSLDVRGFADHLDKINRFGVGAYRMLGEFNNPLNSPPPMLHVIQLWGWLELKTDLPFGFWLRLPSILADVGSLIIVSRLLCDVRPKCKFWGLIGMILAPAAILISGFHGNTDSLVILLVLWSVYLIHKNGTYSVAGIVFGLALCVKVMPLIFFPAILFYAPSLRDRAQFSVLTAATFGFASLPYIIQDPMGILPSVLGYGSTYGQWGLTLFATLISRPSFSHGEFEPLGYHQTFAQFLKFLTVSLALLLSWRLNRQSHKPPLFSQIGLITAIVLALAPGFGVQYLVWLVPFVLVLKLRFVFLYYVVTGIYLVRVYFCFVWTPLCDSAPVALLIHASTWLMVIVLGIRFYLQLALESPNQGSSAAHWFDPA